MKRINNKSLWSMVLAFIMVLSIMPITAFSASNDDAFAKKYTIEDIYAGVATVEDVYGVFDPSTVPEIIGFDYAISQNHVKRLYEDEGNELNKYVFQNIDGSKTTYLYDHPVKCIDNNGRINDIDFAATGGIKNGRYEVADTLNTVADIQMLNASEDMLYSAVIPNYPEISTTASEYTIADGTYYLNNRYCGDYLRSMTSYVTANSGLISSLGNSIRWDITSVSGGYVIRSHSDNTKYLSVSSDTSSSAVLFETVNTTSTIPSRCIWVFDSAGGVGGGCTVKNTYNNKYLYSLGDSVYTSSTLGSAGTSTQSSRAWRVASISYYSNGSGTRQENLRRILTSLLFPITLVRKPSHILLGIIQMRFGVMPMILPIQLIRQ